MRIWAILAAVAFASATLCGCRGERAEQALIEQQATTPTPAPPVARSLIYAIADGMGFTHVAAARIASLGHERRLEMEKLPVLGAATTYNASGTVPDTAAAATALACGVRTDNGVLGQTAELQKVKSIAAAALAAGKRVGLVCAGGLTAPLAAAFFAHSSVAADEREIWHDMLASGAQVLMGGRTPALDGRALEEARKRGFVVIEDASDLGGPIAEAERVLGVFGAQGMPFDLQRPGSVPSLATMAEWAIGLLAESEQGFVLIVLCDRLDDACRARDADNAIGELLAFDRAVGVCATFAEENEDTLLVVASTCETGGMSLVGPAGEGEVPNNVTRFGHPTAVWFGATKTTEDGATVGINTGADVPVFAMGPGAERFAGLLSTSDVARRAAEALGLQLSPVGSPQP